MEPEWTPTSLGETLRDARERQRITLAQAERDTRIRQKHLLAFEEEDVKVFPSSVHARGLVLIYARYLGLDGASVVGLLNRLIGDQDEPIVRPPVEPIHRPSPAISGVAALFLSLALVFGVVFYLYSQVTAYVTSAAEDVAAASLSTPDANRAPSPTPSSQVTSPTMPVVQTPALAAGDPGAIPVASDTSGASGTTVPTPAPNPVVVPTATRVPPSPTAEPPRGVKIDATITGRVWLQVEADGKVVFSGILLDGDSRTWMAQNKIFMHSGNASFVNVTFNGRPLGTLGAPGEVVKVEWTGRS